MTKTILVTGGAGFIGSALTARLAAAGHQVRVLDDFSRGRRERLLGLGCEILDGDIRDLTAVKVAMQGCDQVVHLAFVQGTQTFYAEPRQVMDVGVRGMLNLVDACEATGCGELLLVSSSEAYQVAPAVPTPETVPLTIPDILNPRYSYGGGKIASELMALAWQRAGILDRVVIARPHNVYGPDMGREHVIPEFALRMCKLAREYPAGETVPFPIQGTGLETRSFCHISDCVTQLAALTFADGTAAAPPGATVWHVGSEDEHAISDVAADIADWGFGRTIKIVPGKLPAGSPPRRLPDTSKIRALCGGPRTAWHDGLAQTVAWYRENE